MWCTVTLLADVFLVLSTGIRTELRLSLCPRQYGLGRSCTLAFTLLRRWGDGPLRWIQCLLFLDVEKEVHQFTDFDYMHYDYQYNKKIVCRNCPAAKVVG